MRAPALLAQCLPRLVPHDWGTHSVSSISERDLHLSSPAVEILPSKGRVSVADIIGFNGLDIISSKSDGYLKSWDSSINLVNVLKHEIRDGQLSFRAKRVLKLGSSYGLPGIFACLRGVQVRGKNIKKWKTKEARRIRQQRIIKAKEDLVGAKAELENLPPYEPPKDFKFQ